MAISYYWVGQIPAKPLVIDVRGEGGSLINLSSYDEYNVKMLGSDNEEINLDGSLLSITGAATGEFLFRFPTDRSVFTKSGEYLLQLEFVSAGARDFTTAHTIRVHKLGGKN